MFDVWLYAFVIAFPFALAILWLVVQGLRGKRLCPDCHGLLVGMISPFAKSRRQWLEGGSRCLACGCETDRDGKKVPNGQAPYWPMVFVSVLLPALALAGACSAFSRLLSR